MVILIIISIIVLILLVLLITPIRINIDSERNAYFFQWTGIAKASIIPLPDDFLFRLHIFFWKPEWSLIKLVTKKTEKKEKQKKPKKRNVKKNRQMKFSKWKRKGLRLLKSFKIKALKLNLDTDDYIQNSYLYPVFYFLSGRNRQLSINYEGKVELKFIAENRLYKILNAILF